ncbi:MAG: wbbL 1 [Planctomycetota bacterium]|nr:wbbL 1 [Planctomycetota bacterium]
MPSSPSITLAPSDLPPRLTVVIVNYNGWDDITRLTKSLALSPEVRDGRCEIVVVDNASEGPIPQELASPPRGVRLIVRANNGGFAVGVNTGWRSSSSPWLLLLNPDVETGPELIGRVLARIEFHGSRPEGPPGIVGFGLLNSDGSKQPSVGVEPGLLRSMLGQFIPRSRRKYQAGWRTHPGPVSWVTGACLLLDASLMRALNGMDEDYFLYYEEVALCRSARDLGRRVEYDDAVSVVHLRPLQNRAVPPKLRVIVRHAKLLFFRKHLPFWQFWTLSWLISVESRVREAAARWRSDGASVRAWRTINRITSSMRRGEIVRGRDVLLMAEAATGGASARLDPAAPLPRPAGISPARDASAQRTADGVESFWISE